METNKLLYQYQKQIILLRNNLNKTDYLAIKYAEGALTEVEYAPIKTQRQAWRDEINTIEAQIAQLKGDNQ